MAGWLARPNSTSGAYWRNRLQRVAEPWFIWAAAYEIMALTIYFLRGGAQLSEVPYRIWANVFYQSYWFVPILFFSLAILLPLRRYWQSWWFGLLLLAPSLIYGVNQYYRWFAPSHTVAFFGYLFPLWLGVQLFQRSQTVQAWIDRIPWWLIFTLLCVAFAFMIGEDRVMSSFGFPDTYNALQISNQLYSFVVLAALIKLPVRLVPAFIDVRKESYGIYLSHQIVASIGRGVIDLAAGLHRSSESFFERLPGLIHNPFARIGLWFVWFGLIYTASLLITKALRRTPLAWIVGANE